MTRARVKALHEKVNSILSTLNLGTTLDGMLPHANVLCVIRYEHREEYVTGGPTPDKEGGEEGLQPEATTQDQHYQPQHPGTAGLDTPALPAPSDRHCRPAHPALPAPNRRHCRPSILTTLQ
ncbi:hypothetical protein QYE76_032065 [Lolium multiflorum]|uniref:Uncharacterized protein n=1 Tax=Lolium multiflorum TaxID=4521 RepID=A0AAD8QTC3_LOLMU|nr:hypothetical protein QYE76_032065 [Lolium multiflorum]